ncbi:MAG TPA: hypothetical protein VF085_00075 [Solirubrobacterales bacterium]
MFALALLLGLSATAPTAEAAVEFVYLVNKKELKAGQSLEFLKAADGFPYTFERSTGTPQVKFGCKGLKLIEKSFIFGGKPGSLTTKLEWTGCTGSVGGKACTGITATSTALHGEVVELLFGSSAGFAAMLLYHDILAGEIIRFESVCGGVPDVRIINGSVFAEPSSQCGNSQEVEFLFPGTGSTEVEYFSGRKKVSATMEGSPVTITGSTSFFLPFFFFKWGIC